VTRRAASRREHQKFCETEKWSEVRNARGKPITHHLTYELAVPDGRVLRTRISRPANTDTYGAGLWSHILNDQLCVTEDEFWACIDNGNPPHRTGRVDDIVAVTLPAGLAWQLVHTLGLTTNEIEAMTPEDAVSRMNQHWSEQR
jgi:hypothetical protein